MKKGNGLNKEERLRWMEQLGESQRLTAHEERRKEEVCAILREIYGLSELRFEIPEFPLREPPW